jgi:ligand-binding SRPBCC domain-containing protein
LRGFTVSSRLDAGADSVWALVTTAEGVNYELGPLVRMTVPHGSDLVVREGRLGRSWILLGGVLPIDYDDLYIARLDPGRGFSERSALGSARAWHHDRRVEPLRGGGCTVTDRIAFEPRVAAVGRLQEIVFGLMFRWRHRRLRKRFGVPRPASPPP